MKRYIVTDKQLQKMKDLLENDTFGSYWSEEGREMRYLLEDIEAQEMSYKQAHERFALEAAAAALLANGGIEREKVFLASAITASWYEPRLEKVPWTWIWESAKEAEKEKPGAAYDVFMKALESDNA